MSSWVVIIWEMKTVIKNATSKNSLVVHTLHQKNMVKYATGVLV